MRNRHIILAGLLSLLCLPASTTTTLTLMTYNIHSGFPMGTNAGNYQVTHKDLVNIADVLTSGAADIIGMQEVQCETLAFHPPDQQRTSGINEPRLLAALTKFHYAFAGNLDDPPLRLANTKYIEWGSADKWTNNGETHGEFGNAILSRFKLRGTPENIVLPRENPQDEQRSAIRVEIDPTETSGTRVVVYNTHLHHQGSVPARARQLETILKRASSEPSDAIVFLIGDLNWKSFPGTNQLKALDDLLQKYRFYDLGAPGNEFTCPADKPDCRIDYILCNRPLAVTRSEVLRTLASDHLPLVISVELPAR